MVAVAMTLAVGGVRPVAADVTSDRAAAIVYFPSVIFAEGDSVLGSFFGGPFIDTVIQLSNTSTEPVTAFCFYENANAHCTNTGEVCFLPSDCCAPTVSTIGGCGSCFPGWLETDFIVNLTPRQPLGWLASDGMSGFLNTLFQSPPVQVGTFPLGGPPFGISGIGGASNVGSAIPPVPEEPFIGALRCIAVDQARVPVDRNVLKGEATITVASLEGSGLDLETVGKHNAIGIQAIPGAVNDDNILVLGGDGAEYNGCPNFNILNHFFDGAENPVSGETIRTVLELVPCCTDYLRQIPGAAVIQYLVYNEFEQRFSTSRPFACKQFGTISSIDTTQPTRSIFSAGVGGTLTGQSRFTSIGCGVLAVAHELHGEDLADFNVHFQGDRADSDLIVLP
ncbi:MAG: hypothetical protein AB7V27_06735 [Candidatus Binatia bacterium]